jgi:exosortase B
MSALPGPSTAVGATGVPGRLPDVADRVVLAILLAGLALLYGPTYWDFLYGVHAADSQGHEPLVVGVSAWLVWRQREALARLPGSAAAPRTAAAMLILGLLFYVFGRTQHFLRLELVSQVFVMGAVLLAFKGWAGVRLTWFAFFFLMFAVPLPYTVVVALTAPMKAAVSAVASALLFWAGYPIGRSGVVITIGQYQLLVAEACAGLHTMFTLEALGLLYMKLMDYKAWQRSAALALLVVPVSFCANVVRVITLTLVTYYFGDEVGQGFVHGFAGLLLFAVALALIFGVDRLLGLVLPERWRS